MRIVCISDTHNLTDDLEVPAGDALVHAGDLTTVGNDVQILHAGQWLAGLPHKHKVVVAGNHDWGFFNDGTPAVSRLTQTGMRRSIHYLQDDSVTTDGVKFYGSPRCSGRGPSCTSSGTSTKVRGDTTKTGWLSSTRPSAPGATRPRTP